MFPLKNLARKELTFEAETKWLPLYDCTEDIFKYQILYEDWHIWQKFVPKGFIVNKLSRSSNNGLALNRWHAIIRTNDDWLPKNLTPYSVSMPQWVNSLTFSEATRYPHSFCSVNLLRPRQNSRYFEDDIFTCIFLNENLWILINVSLKFVPKEEINNNPTLVQIMAWQRPFLCRQLNIL